MATKTKQVTQTITVCDLCGEPEGLTSYRKLHSFRWIICYGWRRDSTHEVGVPKKYWAHDGCVAELIEERLATASPTEGGDRT